MTTTQDFYTSTRWTKTRAKRLRMDEYLCKECKRFGKSTVATHVHHIYPLQSHWQIRFIIKNLISLCNNCHEQMHNRVTDELTIKGKQLQARVGVISPPRIL